jgi:hypothetical protein
VSTEQARGGLRKMITSLGGDSVTYALPVGAQQLPLNPLLGQTLELRYAGEISLHSLRPQYQQELHQGYCYPCFKRLARCDSCIVSPQK